MKKTISFLLTAILLLSFSACSAKDDGADFGSDEFLAGYDCAQDWNHIGEVFCKNGEIAYFYPMMHSKEKNIQFAIPKTGEGGVLCGKPECDHRNASCNAYIQDLYPRGLSCYDGRIFWIDRDPKDKTPCIVSCAPDGTDRRTERKLDSMLYNVLSNDVRGFFHRGYLYLSGDNNDVSDAVPRYGSLVYCAAMDGSEKETVILDKQYPENVGVRRCLQAYGTGVYIAEYSWPTESGGPDTLALYRWDTVSRTLETLLEQEISFSVEEMYVVKDGVLLSSSMDGGIYKFGFESKKLERLFDIGAEGGDFSGGVFSGGMVIGCDLDEERRFVFRVTDLAGSVVFDGTVEIPDWREYGFVQTFCGADQNSLYYLLYFHREDVGDYNALVAVDLATSGCRVLWTDQK